MPCSCLSIICLLLHLKIFCSSQVTGHYLKPPKISQNPIKSIHNLFTKVFLRKRELIALFHCHFEHNNMNVFKNSQNFAFIVLQFYLHYRSWLANGMASFLYCALKRHKWILKGIRSPQPNPGCASRGLKKKEDIPLDESDVIHHLRPMECLLFSSCLNADFGIPLKESRNP